MQRLTQNIVVLFDGDEAGLKASLRGLEMILKKGMNVKVCQFPEGQDPDSFSKDNTKQEILEYFEIHTKDFIQFKADLLFKESKNDPIRKSETIREIIQIIAMIPDKIKQEVYVQSCSVIMDISEEVLFNYLAQINSKKVLKEKKYSSNNNSEMQIVIKNKTFDEIDHIFELEHQIITILLLYGDREEGFIETILKRNEKGDLIEERVELKVKVFEKIFLDLQEDEIELAQSSFRELFIILIKHFQSHGSLSISEVTKKLSPQLSDLVSDILMRDELYKLHDWKKKNIFVKARESKVSQLVIETILSLRKFLIDKKIIQLQYSVENSEVDNEEVLSDVISYSQLKKVVAKKLNRVI